MEMLPESSLPVTRSVSPSESRSLAMMGPGSRPPEGMASGAAKAPPPALVKMVTVLMLLSLVAVAMSTVAVDVGDGAALGADGRVHGWRG